MSEKEKANAFLNDSGGKDLISGDDEIQGHHMATGEKH